MPVARKGNSRGETMMRRFCQAVQSGKSPPKEILKFFSDAFSKIEQGEKAEKALEIQYGRGRKKTLPEAICRLLAAVDVIGLMRSGKTYAQAADIVAEREKQSPGTVKRYYSQYKDQAAAFLKINPRLHESILKVLSWPEFSRKTSFSAPAECPNPKCPVTDFFRISPSFPDRNK